MRTTTSVSPLEAAKLIGVAKSTVTRSIKEGKLGASRDEYGRLWIEPVELARAFPKVPVTVADAPVPTPHLATVSTGAAPADKPLQVGANDDESAGAHRPTDDALRRRLAELIQQRDDARTQFQQVREERERERRQLEETVADLRARLDASEVERRQMTERVTALLTDQRSGDVKPRSWWRRLGG